MWSLYLVTPVRGKVEDPVPDLKYAMREAWLVEKWMTRAWQSVRP